jgi:hypothetical protein
MQYFYIYIRKKPSREEKPNVGYDSAVLQSYSSLAAYSINVLCNLFISLSTD